MTNSLVPCPPGVDPKDWMPLYGCTRQAWRKIISGAAQMWWDSLPQSQKDEWDRAYAEAFGLPIVDQPQPKE